MPRLNLGVAHFMGHNYDIVAQIEIRGSHPRHNFDAGSMVSMIVDLISFSSNLYMDVTIKSVPWLGMHPNADGK